ncbi:hypothetical protein ABZ804_22350 [Streptomyces sp. NPDC047726]|uniref:hypothetical protein n=1 Tax=unclassified Streptomyces TaxID=2593676 RepID=UPI003410A285
MTDAFAATYAPLVEQIHTAQAAGDKHAADLALDVLLQAYVRLGRREIGTLQEQNEYIVARHMGLMPKTLQYLGVSPNELPSPPTSRRAPAPPDNSDENAAHIAERFAHIGGAEQPEDRFSVAYRPQDGMRYAGRAAPYAVVDSHDDLPVAWYPDIDWAETTAGTASRLRRT